MYGRVWWMWTRKWLHNEMTVSVREGAYPPQKKEREAERTLICVSLAVVMR